MNYSFATDGTFKVSVTFTLGTFPSSTVTGTYHVLTNKIVMVASDGKTKTFTYRFEGSSLVIDEGNSFVYKMTRVR